MILSLLLSAALAAAPAAAPAVAKPKPPAECHDKTASILWRAGFKGAVNQTAWSIVWRESRGQNLKSGHPQYNGSDVGIWQINRGAWGGSAWWSGSAMTDPRRQSRIVYRVLSKKGTYWRPWGLSPDGLSLDATHYQSWGPDLWDAWIMSPYLYARSIYPKECAR